MPRDIKTHAEVDAEYKAWLKEKRAAKKHTPTKSQPPTKSKPKKYKTGIPDTIKGWAAIRGQIIGRDSFACRICGRSGDEAKLNVHHVDWSRQNNDHTNLVTLCSVCHRAVHMEGYKPCLYEDWPVPWGDHP